MFSLTRMKFLSLLDSSTRIPRTILRMMLSVMVLMVLASCQHTMPPASMLPIGSVDGDNRYIQQPPPEELSSTPSFISSGTNDAPVKIAILLPLTGNFSSLGNDLWNAAQMALFTINQPNIVLVPLDTKGTPFGASDALDEAIKQNISIIVGPVFSASARALLPKVEENELLLMSFSNDDSLKDKGIFLLGKMPDQEVERVINYASYQKIEDFVGLMPSTRFGASAARALRETVEKLPESSVLKTSIYPLKKGRPVNPSKYVYSVLNTAMTKKPAKYYNEEEEKYEDTPILFPRGILIAETPDRLPILMEKLTQMGHNPATLQVLGTSVWDVPEVLATPSLQSAWFARLPKKRMNAFEERYASLFKTSPHALSHLAYDAVTLSAVLLHMADEGMVDGALIKNPRGFLGVSGMFRFLDSGITERALEVVQINDGDTRLLDPAPNSFFSLQTEEGATGNEETLFNGDEEPSSH